MHWIHRQRQGWLVVGLGAALMGGCGSAATSPAQRAGEQGAAAGATPAAPAEDAARPPQPAAGSMPLLPGGDAAPMPIAQPEELAAAMPVLAGPPAPRR